MAFSKQEAIDQARVFMRGQGHRLQAGDWARVINQAIIRFSKDRPRELVYSVTGTGAYTYTLTGVLTGWVNKESRITSIEYPAGAQKPSYLDQGKWTIYRSNSTTEQLKLFEDSPTASETMLINYTTPHTLNDSTSTCEDNDLDVFAYLAAHYAAQAMVSDLLQENRSNLQSDGTDFSQKQADMQKLADKLLEKYVDGLKGNTGDSPSFITAYQDFDIKPSYPGEFIIRGEDER